MRACCWQVGLALRCRLTWRLSPKAMRRLGRSSHLATAVGVRCDQAAKILFTYVETALIMSYCDVPPVHLDCAAALGRQDVVAAIEDVIQESS